MSETVMAYHFVGDRLRDGRPVPPDGEWLVHDGPLVLCQTGLHASRHPFDALTYAPGPILCRVEMAGTIIESDDKLVASRRRIVARVDATVLCRDFARACARDVLHLWDAPDVVRRYLDTGDDTIRDAAWAAAWAASDAAWAARAARAAGWAAVRAAARDAAWAAARAAASGAASDAARAAAWAAASGAASGAAWAAAWDAKRQQWAAMVAEVLP